MTDEDIETSCVRSKGTLADLSLLLARSTRSPVDLLREVVGRAGSYIDWPVTDLLLVLGIYRAVDEFETHAQRTTRLNHGL